MTELILSESAEELLALWQSDRGNAPLPNLKFIDPLRLRRWVGDISVVHLHEGEKRFFVALHGANVGRHLGPNFHRKYLEDAIPAAAHAAALAPYELSMKTNEASYSIQQSSAGSGLFKTLERMILPCASEDPAVAERFLVWVAPVKSNSERSSSVYRPFEEDEFVGIRKGEATVSSELFLLSEKYAAAA